MVTQGQQLSCDIQYLNPALVARYASALCITLFLAFFVVGCDDRDDEALDFDYDIPRAEKFPEFLGEYGLFIEPASALTPESDVHLYELNSELFTDYAGKQRLIRIPEGARVRVSDGAPVYPEGTLLAKTFYFDADLNNPSAGRQIVETRLLIKRGGRWNVATYLWNESQTDATLSLNGSNAEVSFRDTSGMERRTAHEVPSEVACVTCHQLDDETTYIGPKIKSLDRDVERNGVTINQLDHLGQLGVLPSNIERVERTVDYRDTSQSLEARARSYLDMNCAHCHNPFGWDRPAGEGLDLRYETSFASTGISRELRALRRQVTSGEMPFIGTTLLHSEGVSLLLSYFDSL